MGLNRRPWIPYVCSVPIIRQLPKDIAALGVRVNKVELGLVDRIGKLETILVERIARLEVATEGFIKPQSTSQ